MAFSPIVTRPLSEVISPSILPSTIMSLAKRTEPVISIPLERTLVGVAIEMTSSKRTGGCNGKDVLRCKKKVEIGHDVAQLLDPSAALVLVKKPSSTRCQCGPTATEKLRAIIFSRGEKFVVVVGSEIFITH
jgi:hypothetical protein